MTRAKIRFPREMNAQDAFLWNMEEEPVLRSTTAAVTLLDGPPDRALLEARLRQAAADIPRLRQRVVPLPQWVGNPVWVRDDDFDLAFHLRHVRAAGSGQLEEVFALAEIAAMAGFDRDRPLWEFCVVEGLEGGRAALIQKLHHAVTDGVGGMLLMERVYDRDEAPRPRAQVPELPKEPEPGELGLVIEALGRRLREGPALAAERLALAGRAGRHPLAALRTAIEMVPGLLPPREPHSPIARQRSSRCRFHGLDLEEEALRRAAHSQGASLNDAFLAALCGGWRLWHALHGESVAELRATIPVDLRGGSGPKAAVVGNQLATARLDLPAGQPDPALRMRDIRQRVLRERERPLGETLQLLAFITNQLPRAPRRALLASFSGGCDLVASCVPGLPFPLFVAGAKVERLYTFGPSSGTACNATLFSTQESASIALNVDPAAIPDHEVLAECMSRGLDEVLKLA